MKTKKKCKICSKKYEAVRSDSKYCSSACKQRAYYHKAKPEAISSPTPLTFSHQEYEQVLRECHLGYEDIPFIMYCFQRKNLSGKPTIPQLANFISSLWLDSKEILKLNSFQEFQEDFLSNKYHVTITEESALVNPSPTNPSL